MATEESHRNGIGILNNESVVGCIAWHPPLRLLGLFALVLLGACQRPAHAEPSTAKIQRRPLKVVLYPFVPAKDELFYYVERTFEESPEGREIDLQIIDLSANYYNPSKKAAVETTQADVYELDGVFADDFIAAKKIRALPSDLKPTSDAYLPASLAVVTKGADVYGIPHWLCGNFLISKSGDASLSNIGSIDALALAIGHRGLFTDMKGSSTLGELYLDAEVSSLGSFASAKSHLNVGDVDKSDAHSALRKLLALCPAHYCRDEDYHYRDGFYARQFARGAAAAYIGYSETLFDVAEEAQQSCRHDENCTDQLHVQVSGVPFSKSVHSVGWTDVIALNTNCTGQCEADARAFIKFYESEATTMALLLPKDLPPRYLLPGRKGLYLSKDLLAKAPLYTQFWSLISKAEIVTSATLNGRLRAVGAELDKSNELPDH